MNIVKPLGPALTLSAAGSNVSSSTLVFLTCVTTSNVSVMYANGTLRASVWMANTNNIFVEKAREELLVANGGLVYATASAYRG